MQKLNGLTDLSAALPTAITPALKPALAPAAAAPIEKPKRALPDHLKKHQFKPGHRRG